MKIVIILISALMLSFNLAFTEIDPHAYPTEFEFNVYKYYVDISEKSCKTLSIQDKDPEERIIERTASWFNISEEDVKIIENKFNNLELALYSVESVNEDSELTECSIVSYSWSEIKRLIDRIGWEKILDWY